MSYLCTRFQLRIKLRTYQAQMAESVDALVSNTSGATRAGSTPALGTRSTTTCWSQRKAKCCKTILTALFLFTKPKFFSRNFPHIFPTNANLMQLNGNKSISFLNIFLFCSYFL